MRGSNLNEVASVFHQPRLIPIVGILQHALCPEIPGWIDGYFMTLYQLLSPLSVNKLTVG
jgi:hypothetical protein